MKNSFYFRSICGVLSVATLMHSFSDKKQVAASSYELSCKTKLVMAIANSKRHKLPCATKVAVIKEVNDKWSLVEVKESNKQYLVQASSIRQSENLLEDVSYATSKP